MAHIIIGTAGHVDHGKTSLIRALTGIETDRLKEEKKRGITIELGFAYLDLPDGSKAGIVDVPGHEKFINNMLAGAGGMDLVLLIIAADEGIMPQTREHFEILRLLDIQQGVVVLTKKDMVDEDWLMLVEDDVRQWLQGTFLENAPIMAVSSATGEGVKELREEIFRQIAHCRGKKEDAPFREAIDRVFTMEGFGTVITGTILEGKVSVGDALTLFPEEQEVRVRSLQVHGEDCKTAYAGQRTAINLAQVSRQDVLRGDCLAAPGSMACSDFWEIELKVLDSSPYEIKTSSRLHVHIGSRQFLARIRIFGADVLKAGDSAVARLSFDEEVAAKAGDRFVLRFYSPLDTVAGGRVLDPEPQRRKVDPEKHERLLKAWQAAEPDERLYYSYASQALQPQDLNRAWRRSGLYNEPESVRRAALDKLLTDGRLIALTDQAYLTAEQLQELGEKADRILQRFHQENALKSGMKREEMRTRLLPQMPIDLSDKVLTALAERHYLTAYQHLIAAKDFKVERNEQQLKLQAGVLEDYRRAGYQPPTTSEMMAKLGKKDVAKALMDDLLEQGLLVRLDAEIYMAKEQVDAAEALVRELCAAGPMRLADFRDRLETSRKFAVALLDYFDRIKLTRMQGDVRILIG